MNSVRKLNGVGGGFLKLHFPLEGKFLRKSKKESQFINETLFPIERGMGWLGCDCDGKAMVLKETGGKALNRKEVAEKEIRVPDS